MFLSWWANPWEPWVVSPAHPLLLMMSLYMPILMLWMIWKMAGNKTKHKHKQSGVSLLVSMLMLAESDDDDDDEDDQF